MIFGRYLNLKLIFEFEKVRSNISHDIRTFIFQNMYQTLYYPFWTGWCVNVLSSTGVIKSLVSSNKQLRRLILTAHRQTSDSDIEAIYLLGSTLEQFSCMGSRNVSPEAILDLAMHCPNLLYLDVSYCDQLETAHVIHDRLRTLLPNCNVQISINHANVTQPKSAIK